MFEFLKSRDIHCTITAGLFMLGNFLTVVYMIALPMRIERIEKEWVGEGGDLGVAQLIQVFIARLSLQGLQTTAVLIGSFAWIFLAVVLIKLAWVLSSKGKHSLGTTFTIAVLAVAGTLAEFISGLLYIGMARSTVNVMNTYELNSWLDLSGPGFSSAQSEAGQSDGDEPINDSTADGQDETDADFGQKIAESIANTLAPTSSPIVSLPDSVPGNDTAIPLNETVPNGGDRFLEEVGNFDIDQYDAEDDQDFYIDGDTTNESYDADGLGWKTLELIQTVSAGLFSFIDAAESLFIAAILVMTFVAVFRKGQALFSMSWALFGLLLSLSSMAQFATAVLAEDSTAPLYSISTLLTFVNQVFLLPIWILWLGQQMQTAQATKMEVASATGAMS